MRFPKQYADVRVLSEGHLRTQIAQWKQVLSKGTTTAYLILLQDELDRREGGEKMTKKVYDSVEEELEAEIVVLKEALAEACRYLKEGYTLPVWVYETPKAYERYFVGQAVLKQELIQKQQEERQKPQS